MRFDISGVLVLLLALLAMLHAAWAVFPVEKTSRKRYIFAILAAVTGVVAGFTILLNPPIVSTL